MKFNFKREFSNIAVRQKWWFLVFVHSILPRFRSKESGVLSVTPGELEPHGHRKLCIFAHFDRDGMVDDYVLNYLRALMTAGVETIFCSTAQGLPKDDIEKLRPFCRTVIVRRNIGYDFASYRTGLEQAGELSRYDAVILANDSAYGPLCDLTEMFASMENEGADFWSITDSHEFAHHLQSYFLVFNKAVVTSSVFKEFWCVFPNYSHKLAVIAKGEIGLSKLLAGSGFKMSALCETARILKENPDSADLQGTRYIFFRPPFVNQAHYDWKLLVERYGCPFIKIELLRDNPKTIAGVSDWESVIRRVSNYDPELIHNHLLRVKSHAAALS